jgi:hypothetical protein
LEHGAKPVGILHVAMASSTIGMPSICAKADCTCPAASTRIVFPDRVAVNALVE